MTDCTTSTASTALTSVVGGFTAQMVGNVVWLGAAAADDGRRQIVAFVSATQVTLDSNAPATRAGVGFAKVGGAYLLSNNAFGFNPVAGNKIWIKAGTYLLSSNSARITTGSVTQPVIVEGYNTTRGDLARAVNLTRPVLKWSASSIYMFTFDAAGGICRGLAMDATGSGVGCVNFTGSSTNCVLENCKLTCDTNSAGVVSTGVNHVIRRCYVLAGTGASDSFSIGGSGNNLIEFNRCKGGTGNSGAGLALTNGGAVLRNNIFEKHQSGVLTNSSTLRVLHMEQNICSLNTYGLRINDAAQGVVGVPTCRWNIFSQNSTSDIEYSPADISLNTGAIAWMNENFETNFFYTTGTNRYKNLPTGYNDQILTANPFTDAAAGDYSLNSVTGGGALISDTPIIIPFGDDINFAYLHAGIVGCPPATSPAAFTVAMSLWRELTNEPDSVQIPDAIPTIYVDAGCEALNRRIRYYWKTDSAGVVLVAGTQEYTLPQDLVELRWVQWNGKELVKGNIDEWRNRGDDWRNEPAGEPREWAMYSNQIVFRPAPSSEAVATAASPVLRYCGKPPSVATLAFDQLNTQDFRIPVYYGVAEWSASYPDVEVARGRVQYYTDRFNQEAGVIAIDYADRGTKP